jgi:hypothetical protein
MALEPLQLADVTWEDLVALARRRIAAVTRGEWTLHAPVDPGVTLLELFAWLLEQRVYWLDQVPDALTRALLTLLGVSPAGEGIADTVLAFAGADDGSWPVVPAGTAMRLVGSPAGPVYSTDESLVAAPVRSLGLHAGGRERGADLDAGRWVQLLAGDGSPGEFELRLELATPPPVDAGARLGLLLALEVAPAMTPEWRKEGADEKPPAALFPAQGAEAPVATPPARVPVEFLYRRTGASELAPLPELTDGTNGLRRAGVVRFRAPADWAPGADGRFAVVVRAARTDFAVPPRLSGVHANAVVARHLRRVVVALRRSWLPLPGTAIELSPALGAPLPRYLRVHLRERATPDRWQVWTPVDELATSGPAARVVRVDRARTRIEFGDGLTGRQPVLSQETAALAPPFDLAGAALSEAGANVIVEYLVGGGEGGDLGAGQDFTAVDGDSGFEAHAPLTASGGRVAEALTDARTRAAAELRAPWRAVTRADYQELARTTPGVAIARAHAAVGAHPAHPCRSVPGATTVYLVPWAPRDEDLPPGSDAALVRAPAPDPDTLALVQARLERVRLAGHEVFVAGPRYRPARLRFEVEADTRTPAQLEERVRRALVRYLDPLVGGDDADGWPFGEPLRPSALVRAAQRTLARDGEVRAVAIALDGAPGLEVSCTDVGIGTDSLPRLDQVSVTFVPRRAQESLR